MSEHSLKEQFTAVVAVCQLPHLCLHHVVPVGPHLHDKAEDVDLLPLRNHLHHGCYGNQCTSTAHTGTAGARWGMAIVRHGSIGAWW